MVKMNFTMPEKVAADLKAHVGKSKRSAFVAEAIRSKLAALQKEQLRQELIEGYRARTQEDAEMNAEWQAVTLEKWE